MPVYPNDSDYVDPAFFSILPEYDPELARALTFWLYSDPESNPNWEDPTAWPTGGRVQLGVQDLNFASLSRGGFAKTERLSLATRRRCVALSVSGMVTTTTPVIASAAIQLANQNGSYVNVEIRRAKGGAMVFQNAPINNLVGILPGWPERSPTPEMWKPGEDLIVVVTNNGNQAMDVRLSWEYAILTSN